MGQDGGVFWLAPSLKYLDFDWNVLLKESVIIGSTGNTVFNFDTLASMDFDKYEFLIKVINEVYKEKAE